MRGTDGTRGSLFSYVHLEARVPARYPLRKIRQVVNDELASLDAGIEVLYTDFDPTRAADPGQPAPDPVLGALQAADDGAAAA